jgi:hypothetical protein
VHFFNQSSNQYWLFDLHQSLWLGPWWQVKLNPNIWHDQQQPCKQNGQVNSNILEIFPLTNVCHKLLPFVRARWFLPSSTYYSRTLLYVARHMITLLRSLCMMTGSTVPSIIVIHHESGSTYFISVYCSEYYISTHHI